MASVLKSANEMTGLVPKLPPFFGGVSSLPSLISARETLQIIIRLRIQQGFQFPSKNAAPCRLIWQKATLHAGLLLSKQTQGSRSSRPQPLRLYLKQTEACDNTS